MVNSSGTKVYLGAGVQLDLQMLLSTMKVNGEQMSSALLPLLSFINIKAQAQLLVSMPSRV